MALGSLRLARPLAFRPRTLRRPQRTSPGSAAAASAVQLTHPLSGRSTATCNIRPPACSASTTVLVSLIRRSSGRYRWHACTPAAPESSVSPALPCPDCLSPTPSSTTALHGATGTPHRADGSPPAHRFVSLSSRTTLLYLDLSRRQHIPTVETPLLGSLSSPSSCSLSQAFCRIESLPCLCVLAVDDKHRDGPAEERA